MSVDLNNDLEDIWRLRNTKVIRYTFHRKESNFRIDFFLTKKHLNPFIKCTLIAHCPFSDHEIITLKLQSNLIKIGPGYWKMNAAVLQSDRFRQVFETFWNYWKHTVKDFENYRKWWECTKEKIKSLSIQVAASMNKQNREIKKLEKEFENLKSNSSHDNYEELENKLKTLHRKQCEAARVRSRVKHYEAGEQSTKYFFNLEKRNAINKTWVSIKKADGAVTNKMDDILNEQVKFYSSLFSSEGWDEQSANTLLNNVTDKLKDEDKNALEITITELEVKNAIFAAKENKSPGENGIISEFYKTFWYLIKDEFYLLINEIFESAELSETQNRGILSLLFKKGDRTDIKKLATNHFAEYRLQNYIKGFIK